MKPRLLAAWQRGALPPAARACSRRLVRRSQPKQVALVAAARTRLALLVTLRAEGRDFDPTVQRRTRATHAGHTGSARARAVPNPRRRVSWLTEPQALSSTLAIRASEGEAPFPEVALPAHGATGCQGTCSMSGVLADIEQVP